MEPDLARDHQGPHYTRWCTVEGASPQGLASSFSGLPVLRELDEEITDGEE